MASLANYRNSIRLLFLSLPPSHHCLMSGKESKKKKKVPEVLSWKQKQERADKDEEAVKKEVEELISWTKMIETMNDEQLKEYLLNRPKSLKSAKTAKSAPSKMAKQAVKPRASSSQGIMASVWKFHKEEDEEAAVTVPV